MPFIPVASIAVAALLSTSGFAQTPAAASAIAGEWRGESVCANLILAPACKDETIGYVFTAVKDSPVRLHLVAEKLIGGRFESMGEFDVVYSPADRTWRYDFETRQQTKLRWEYTLDGSMLAGVIVTRDSGEVLRKVNASRPKSE